MMYYNGQGVLQDKVRAYAMYSLAAINDYEDSMEQRDLISEELSKEEREEGLEIAKGLLKNYR